MLTIDDITTAIDQSNAAQTEAILAKFCEINKRIDEIECRVNAIVSDVDNTKSVTAKLEGKIIALEDKLERKEKEDEIIIRNIPYLRDEKTADIFHKICATIGCAVYSPMPAVRRFIPRLNDAADKRTESDTANPALRMRTRKALSTLVNQATNAIRPPVIATNILVKFFIQSNKAAFMKAYFEFINLNLTSIGFSSQERIIIRDNLTPKNHELFCIALKLRKTGQITKVKTISGLVYIHSKDKQSYITSKTDFASFYISDQI